MKKNYTVTTTVSVQLDESKFTPEFLREYQETIHDLPDIEAHRKNLAELYATGRIGNYGTVEGYGKLSDMGIRCEMLACEIEDEYPDGE
jgi:hypothetical protein